MLLSLVKKKCPFILQLINTIVEETQTKSYYNLDQNNLDLFSLFLTKQFKIFFNHENIHSLKDSTMNDVNIKFIDLYDNKIISSEFDFYINNSILISDVFEINLWKNKNYYLDVLTFNEKFLFCQTSSTFKIKKIILMSNNINIKIIGDEHLYEKFGFKIKKIRDDFNILTITSKFESKWYIKFCIVQKELV